MSPVRGSLLTGTIGSVSYTHLDVYKRQEYSLNENMRQCIDVILTRIISVIDIKAGMPQTILRKHNIQRAQYLYNDSIGIELQVLETL